MRLCAVICGYVRLYAVICSYTRSKQFTRFFWENMLSVTLIISLQVRALFNKCSRITSLVAQSRGQLYAMISMKSQLDPKVWWSDVKQRIKQINETAKLYYEKITDEICHEPKVLFCYVSLSMVSGNTSVSVVSLITRLQPFSVKIL